MKKIETTKSHYPLVDSLRGVAILLVLILHFHLAYKLTEGFLGGVLNHPILSRLVRNGNYGVVMFFVISGFLITSRTLARFGSLKNIQVRDFYVFRVGRILPNILLMLSIVVALGLLGITIFQNSANGPSLFITIASVLTFTHNMLMLKYEYFNYCLNILWSLSVEEVFYLIFPVLCLLSKRKWIPLTVWSSMIVISPIFRFTHRHDAEDIYGLYHYLSCFDGIAIGCLAAYFRKTLVISERLKKLVPILLAGIAVIYFYDGIWSNVVFGISGVSLLMGLVLLLMEGPEQDRSISYGTKVLHWFGRHSYELYLFHIIVLALMKTWVARADIESIGKLTWFLTFMIASSLVSALVARFYSEPLNQKIRLIFESSKAPE